jgi:RNA polymerase sigma factor (sigma-70 family)
MTDDVEQRFLDEILSCKGILHKISRSYSRDSDDRDDLYQEIVANAWNSFARFEGRSKFSTWLYRVALNTALSHVRKNRFRKNQTGLENVEATSPLDTDAEHVRLLYQAIDHLTPGEKSLAILYLEDLPYREIAGITGMTETNVGVRIHRIKEKLKEWFNRKGHTN